jgi:hypothetical protein
MIKTAYTGKHMPRSSRIHQYPLPEFSGGTCDAGTRWPRNNDGRIWQVDHDGLKIDTVQLSIANTTNVRYTRVWRRQRQATFDLTQHWWEAFS